MNSQKSINYTEKHLRQDRIEEDIQYILKNVEWNLDNNEIELILYTPELSIEIFNEYNDFYKRLLELAEIIDDSYISQNQSKKSKLNIALLVDSCLEDYQDIISRYKKRE